MADACKTLGIKNVNEAMASLDENGLSAISMKDILIAGTKEIERQ